MSLIADILGPILHATVEPALNRWFDWTSAKAVGWVFAGFAVLTLVSAVLIKLHGDERWPAAGICGGLITFCVGLLWIVKYLQERGRIS